MVSPLFILRPAGRTIGQFTFRFIEREIPEAKDHQGEQVELTVLVNSQFFGMMSFISGKPRSSSVAALDKSLLVEFNLTSMERLLQEHSPAKTVILNFYQERLADLNRKIARGSH